MDKKQAVQIDIERTKHQIKQHESALDREKRHLLKLEKDLERQGPRLFVISEIDYSKSLIISGRQEQFSVMEVYDEYISIPKGSVLVKEIRRG